ncbi:uncharacterized protein EV420DRAFT_1771383 [Desarmillaria tabescens]|uniref:Uncharacterized protein n=1 Tax=Armillaria tabescens TaxID=1929756 RepID=A0AA39J157_ARMTA|nr:uncharacterized protein EV420DRAFT_1771383 [Desarmillaria tabescens]KAK0433590.1 hypothetical protein EV420DRAFT_1771383 [Desarmillaria tabescens]
MAGKPIIGCYNPNVAPTKFVKGGHNGEYLKSGDKRRSKYSRRKRTKKIPVTRSSSPIVLSSPEASKAMHRVVHTELSTVPECKNEIIPDSEPEGAICPLLDPLELMACDMDLTVSSHLLLYELEGLQQRFDPSVSTRHLRMGLKSAREAVEKLEQLADWMDTADLMQWSRAVEAHQAVWAGWKEFQERQSSSQHPERNDN